MSFLQELTYADLLVVVHLLLALLLQLVAFVAVFIGAMSSFRRRVIFAAKLVAVPWALVLALGGVNYLRGRALYAEGAARLAAWADYDGPSDGGGINESMDDAYALRSDGEAAIASGVLCGVGGSILPLSILLVLFVRARRLRRRGEPDPMPNDPAWSAVAALDRLRIGQRLVLTVLTVEWVLAVGLLVAALLPESHSVEEAKSYCGDNPEAGEAGWVARREVQDRMGILPPETRRELVGVHVEGVTATRSGFAIVAREDRGRFVRFYSRDGRVVATQRGFASARGTQIEQIAGDKGGGVYLVSWLDDHPIPRIEVHHIRPSRRVVRILRSTFRGGHDRMNVLHLPKHLCLFEMRVWSPPRVWPINRAQARVETRVPEALRWSPLIFVAALLCGLVVVRAHRAGRQLRMLRRGSALVGETEADADGDVFVLTTARGDVRVDAAGARVLSGERSAHRVVLASDLMATVPDSYRESAIRTARAEVVFRGKVAEAELVLEHEYRTALSRERLFALAIAVLLIAAILLIGADVLRSYPA